MRRALALVTVLLLSACPDRFQLDTPHQYKCSADGGSAQCGTVGHSVCNLTAGYCIDLDAGEPFPCASDLECGHGWRCGIAHVCADPSNEPPLVPVDLAPPTLATPDLDVVALRSSQSSLVYVASQLKEFNDLVISQRDGGLVWLFGQAVEEPGRVSMHQDAHTSPVPLAIDQQPTAGVVASNGNVLHLLAALVDGGAFVVSLDSAGALTERPVPGPYEQLRSVRTTPGLSLPSDPIFAFISGNRVSIARAQAFEGGLSGTAVPLDTPVTFNGVVADLAYFRPGELGDAGVLLAATSAGLERLVEGGSPTPITITSAPVLNLRLGRGALSSRAPSLAWRSGDGLVHVAEYTGAFQETTLPVTPCVGLDKDGGATTLLTYGFNREGVPNEQCTTLYGDVTLEDGNVNPLYQHRTVTTDATDWWAWSIDTGQVTRSLLGSPLPVSPFEAPESLEWSPKFGVLAIDQNLAFQDSSLGFSVANIALVPNGGPSAFVSVPVKPDGGIFSWVVSRSGEVSEYDPFDHSYQAVAAPIVTWKLPTAPILLRHLVDQKSGHDVLMAVHDDTIDVTELVPMQFADLTPRVLPSPGLPVRDLALVAVADGGFAEGFAIAGTDLIALSAPSPRRWSTTRVALPASPVHVWYEGASPRVTLDDGQVVGIASGTRIADGVPGLEVVDATTVCPTDTTAGVPVLLSVELVISYGPAGWAPLLGQLEDGGSAGLDFSRGRVFAVDGGWYAFDSAGTPWFGACP
jgi:hypothetical protein